MWMKSKDLNSWASYHLRKIAGCACAGNAGTFSPLPWVSNPDMHHGTCVTHVPWWIPGSLCSGFLWSRWRGKRSRHSRRMRNPQLYVSGKRPMEDDQCSQSSNRRFLLKLNRFFDFVVISRFLVTKAEFERCNFEGSKFDGLHKWLSSNHFRCN